MAQLIAVDDPTDPRLADYVSLRDVQLRRHLEATNGFFIAEGEKVVRRAVAAGYPVRSFLMAERWLGGLEAELRTADAAPCYVVSEALAESVTGFHVHRGALAALERPPLPSVDTVLAGARRIVLLEDVVDSANVGAVFRSAAALGMDAVLLSPRCADPLYRRSVKVAMGAVFSVPWTRLEDWYDAVPALGDEGFTTIALTPDPAAEDLVDVIERKPTGKVCLILGSEGSGLSSRWLVSAETRAGLAMANDVDSLNIAAAAAIAFFVVTHRCHEGWDRGD